MDSALFLGTGASLGVPLVGCSCEVCQSNDPKNKRLRSSLLLNIQNKNIIIDAGPDLRQQALQHQIKKLDGVIFTHAHHDHTAGIDELRVFYFKNKKSIPCLVSDETAKDLEKRFHFMLEEQPKEIADTKRIELILFKEKQGVVSFLNVPIHIFSYEQLGMQVWGVRIGDFAYVTDIKNYNEKIFSFLNGVKTLVISALRFTSSHMHFTVDEAIDFTQKVHPEKAYLTHTSHELDYQKTNAYLPNSIQLAYDGLKILL